MKCRKCGSERVVKAGFTTYKTQMWKCKDCDYRNTMTGGIVVKGRRGEACIICGGETTARNLCSHHYQKLARAERAKRREEARIALESVEE